MAVDARIVRAHLWKMLTQADIQEMTIPERLEAIDKLWVSIAEAGAEMPSPEWHKDVLDQRRARARSGKAKFFTVDEARQKLKLPRK
jgi:putative addiction module component (TIGR02574 family)